jgi:phosphoribosylamine---glycine ligase
LTPEGPKVLEFNVRFGDPEAQVVLPRLDGDLTGLLAEVAAGELTTVPRFLPGAAVCVVLASEGYPDAPRTGDEIAGLAEAGAIEGVTVFHAGTAAVSPAPAPGPDAAGAPVAVRSAGGRVLGVTALADSIGEARVSAYRGVAAISWPGMQSRADIAQAASDPHAGVGPAERSGPGPSTSPPMRPLATQEAP